MKKLSVIVNGLSNNERFINNLFTEISDEIATEIKDNKVLLFNIQDEKIVVFYNSIRKYNNIYDKI